MYVVRKSSMIHETRCSLIGVRPRQVRARPRCPSLNDSLRREACSREFRRAQRNLPIWQVCFQCPSIRVCRAWRCCSITSLSYTGVTFLYFYHNLIDFHLFIHVHNLQISHQISHSQILYCLISYQISYQAYILQDNLQNERTRRTYYRLRMEDPRAEPDWRRGRIQRIREEHEPRRYT